MSFPIHKITMILFLCYNQRHILHFWAQQIPRCHISWEEKVLLQDLVSGKQTVQGRETFCLSVQRSEQTARLDDTRSSRLWYLTLGSKLGQRCTSPAFWWLRLSSTYNQSKTNKEKPSGKCFRQNSFIFLCSKNNLDKFSIREHNLITWSPLFLNRWNLHTLFK